MLFGMFVICLFAFVFVHISSLAGLIEEHKKDIEKVRFEIKSHKQDIILALDKIATDKEFIQHKEIKELKSKIVKYENKG